MKKFVNFYLSVSTLFLMVSCSTYSVKTFQPDQNNGSDCPNPIYVGTMYKSRYEVIKTDDGDLVIKYKTSQRGMTLVSLLMDARKKYGEDVTIHNVRWDTKRRKKIGVIYDVIKCK